MVEENKKVQEEKNSEYDYFTPDEILKYSFIRVPKILIVEKHFKSLSVESKLLFGLMQDRASLSNLNNWKDEYGRIFIIFSIEDVREVLGVGQAKAVKLLKELEDFGLIEKKKQGQGKPTIIFVKNPYSYKNKFNKLVEFENRTQEKNSSNFKKDIEKNELFYSYDDINVSNLPEIKNEFEKYENRISRSSKIELQEVSKSNSNNTNINNNYKYENIDENLSNQSGKIDSDRIDLEIKKQINFEYLYHKNKDDSIMIFNLIKDIFIKNKGYEMVNGEKTNIEIVKNKFRRLTDNHILYVIDSLKNISNIRNVRNYLITALYNAESTMSLYYQNEINNNFSKENSEQKNNFKLNDTNDILSYDWLNDWS